MLGVLVCIEQVLVSLAVLPYYMYTHYMCCRFSNHTQQQLLSLVVREALLFYAQATLN